jgi:hypothetical protein
MAKKNMPPSETLRQLIRYDGDTGKLFWKPRGPEWFSVKHRAAETMAKGWNSKYAGKIAFDFLSTRGYRFGILFDDNVYAHRIIFSMHYPDVEMVEIDHIDGDKSNNLLPNLRNVTHMENMKNIPLSSSNTSGVIGVSWSNAYSKWTAAIKCEGVTYSLGSFDKKEDAIAARKNGEARFGFHPNNGRKLKPTLYQIGGAA